MFLLMSKRPLGRFLARPPAPSAAGGATKLVGRIRVTFGMLNTVNIIVAQIVILRIVLIARFALLCTALLLNHC